MESLEARQLLAAAKFAVISNFGVDNQNELNVANLVKSWTPEFIVSLGDNNYPSGSASTIDQNVGKYYQEYIYPYLGSYGSGSPTGTNRFFPVLGNHDWETTSGTPALPTPYLNYFTLPGNERYYTFTRGPVQFFALDSSSKEPDGNTSTSIQGQWLQQALAASTATWKVVYFHQPPYSSASDTSAEMNWPFQSWGADLVLSGHRHTYERIIRNNFPYIVNGMGGAPFSDWTTITTGSQLRYNEQHGAMLVEAGDSSLKFRFITHSGQTIDTYTLYKTAALPDAPGNLTAEVVSGTQIELKWTDFSSNESSFELERSTDGASFSRIATISANTFRYADSNRASNTTYYYRVRAINASGSSAYSSVTSVKTPALTPIISSGSTWKYLDNGTDQGTAWRSSSFDDSTWKSGAGQLGYGDGDEATVVSYGPSSTARYITTYFRRTFSVTDPSAFSNLVLSLLRDDGAVVYLNGTEVFRSNMPTGTILYTTLASSGIGSADENTWHGVSLSPNMLVAGTNVIAVEVHQNSASSSDLSFDLQLGGTTSTPATIPSAPSGLVATAVLSSQINLSWSDNSDNESGFLIERATAGGAFVQIATVAAGVRSYSNTGLTASTSYSYRVRAYNGAGNSSYSNTASATTSAASSGDTLVPAGAVWRYLDNGTDQGTAWRAILFDDSTWKSGAAQLGYGDGDEVTRVSYGPSSSSKYITTYFRHSFSVTDPSAITGLQLKLMRDDGAVVYLNGVEVFRSNMPTGTITYTTLASSGVDSSAESTWYTASLVPALLVAGNNVIAVEVHQVTASSSDVTFNFELTASGGAPSPTLPGAPSGLVATGVSTSQINLGWTDNASNETGFEIERSTDGVNFTRIATVGVNVTQYSNSGLAAGTLYYYRVRAVNTSGNSAYATASGRTIDVPPVAPSGLTANGITTSQIRLSWADNSNNETGFKIERSSDGVNFTQIATVGAGVTSYSNTGLSAGAGYWYRVRAYNGGGDSGYSNTASAATATLQTLVSAGSTWKYLDNGSNQGTAWRSSSFDDSTWKSGAGQLGYGDGDEATRVNYGSDTRRRYITTYFRRAFTVTDPTAFLGLTLRLLRDDGAVVYLNGVEVVRSNMPGGTIGYTTLASSTINGSAESTWNVFTINASMLVAGTNVLAVEIHQVSAKDGDISFDLALLAEKPTPAPTVGGSSASLTLFNAVEPIQFEENQQAVWDDSEAVLLA